MSINKTSSSSFTSGVVIGDNASNDSPVTLSTDVDGNPVSAVLELKSTKGALLLPRMTSDQINNIGVQVDGMMAYNTDLNYLVVRQSGNWQVSFTPSFSTATVTLDGTDIHALNVPIQLVQNGGPNTLLVPLKVTAVYSYTAPVFTTAATLISIKYGNGDNATTDIDAALLTAAEDRVCDVLGVNGAPPVPIQAQINTALSISSNAPFAAGNLASTLKLTVFYTTLNIA